MGLSHRPNFFFELYTWRVGYHLRYFSAPANSDNKPGLDYIIGNLFSLLNIFGLILESKTNRNGVRRIDVFIWLVKIAAARIGLTVFVTSLIFCFDPLFLVSQDLFPEFSVGSWNCLFIRIFFYFCHIRNFMDCAGMMNDRLDFLLRISSVSWECG